MDREWEHWLSDSLSRSEMSGSVVGTLPWKSHLPCPNQLIGRREGIPLQPLGRYLLCQNVPHSHQSADGWKRHSPGVGALLKPQEGHCQGEWPLAPPPLPPTSPGRPKGGQEWGNILPWQRCSEGSRSIATMEEWLPTPYVLLLWHEGVGRRQLCHWWGSRSIGTAGEWSSTPCTPSVQHGGLNGRRGYSPPIPQISWLAGWAEGGRRASPLVQTFSDLSLTVAALQQFPTVYWQPAPFQGSKLS